MIKDIVVDDSYRTDLATSWGEISLEQFFRLELWNQTEEKNLIEAVAALTDIPLEIWNKSSYGDFKYVILPNIQWIFTDPKIRKIRMKDSIEIMGKEIEIPKNLEYESLGQKVAVDQKTAEYADRYKEDPTRMGFYQMSYAIAAYVSPLISGDDFDMKFTDIVQVAVQKARAIDVIPVGTFFLKSQGDSINLRVISQSIFYRIKNAGLIPRTFKSLGFFVRGMRWRKAMSVGMKKY